MKDVTLEDLAKRVAALESIVGVRPPAPGKDWRNAASAISDPEFHLIIDAEGAKIREAERKAAEGGHEG